MSTNIMMKRALATLTSTAATTRFSSCLSLRLFRSNAAAADVDGSASSVLKSVNPHFASAQSGSLRRHSPPLPPRQQPPCFPSSVYAEVVPHGRRVRLENLPKKKNIHRDLNLAMRGVPGIINIVPAVTGNIKTRDPICKGFAFVDFKRKKDAVSFVELYTGQTITFGKIQKQIKCEVVNAQSSSSQSSSSLQLSKNLHALPLPSEQGTINPTAEPEKKSSAKVRQENSPKKKLISKKKVKKVSEIPVSAKRLKIKKKSVSVLSRVLSKYGSRAVVASKDD